jgi:hypothetical protein
MQKFLRLIFLLSALPLLADEQTTHNLPSPTQPWFTGPLVAPSGFTARAGSWNIEPYFYYSVNTGRYNSHWKPFSTPNFTSISVQVQTKVGLAHGLDFQFFPQAIYNETQGSHYCNVGDMPIAFNVQLLRYELNDWWPAMKLSLRANVPWGKYQHLNPHLKKTDALGAGSWLPGAGLIFSKLWNTSGMHNFEWRLAFLYQIGTGVHVKGLNTYGGAHDTRGTAYPGNSLTVDGAFQYSLTQQWAIACDLIYAVRQSRRLYEGPVQ